MATRRQQVELEKKVCRAWLVGSLLGYIYIYIYLLYIGLRLRLRRYKRPGSVGTNEETGVLHCGSARLAKLNGPR